MTVLETRREVIRPLLVAAAFAGLWAILAVSRDGITYHLAPLLVAGIPAAGLGIEGKSTVRLMALGAIAGAAIALAVTFLLAAIGKLEGPSLLPFGGAAAEAVIFSAFGAAAGLAIGIWSQRAD